MAAGFSATQSESSTIELDWSDDGVYKEAIANRWLVQFESGVVDSVGDVSNLLTTPVLNFIWIQGLGSSETLAVQFENNADWFSVSDLVVYYEPDFVWHGPQSHDGSDPTTLDDVDFDQLWGLPNRARKF